MTLPSLPTDSLYKFLALAGLVVLFFSYTYPPEKSRELRRHIAELRGEADKLGKEIDFLSEDIAEAKKKGDQITLETWQSLQKRSQEQKLKDVDAKRGLALLEIDQEGVEYYSTMGQIGLFLGWVLTIGGFLLWYVRVQRPSDHALALSAKPAEKAI